MFIPLRSGYRHVLDLATNWLTLRDEPQLKGHVPALDAIRGLAIVLVTLYRFNEGPVDSSVLGKTIFGFCSLGFRGVDLFFVLSGFLITGILHDAKEKPHYFRDFYMRRTLRIFPLYYATLLVTLIVLPRLLPSAADMFREAIDNQVWLWIYGANVVQSWQDAWPLGRFNHFWSLAVEEHFYLVWPLLIYLTSRQSAMRLCLGILICACGGRAFWLLAGGGGVAAEVLTVFRMDALALGAFLALAVRGPGGIRSLYPWAVIGLIATGVLLVPPSLLGKRVLTTTDTLFAAFFGCLIILALCTSREGLAGRLWNSSLLRFFGKYSYGMYVFQNLLIPLLAPLVTAESLAEQFGSPLWGKLAYLCVMSLATTLAAVASWHLFEKHVLKLKTSFGG